MINWARRKFSSESGPAIDALKQFQHQSQQRMQARRFVFLISSVVFPLSCLSLYDRISGYPEPLGRHRFPLIARLYIRKSMLLRKPDDLEGIAKDLDSALGSVLTSGLGAASPQATALVIYLSQLYLKSSDTPNSRLEEALAALLHKPHVGESLDDEKARLRMGFEVLKRLHSVYSADRAAELLDRYETIVRKCPPQISFHLLQDVASYKSLKQ